MGWRALFALRGLPYARSLLNGVFPHSTGQFEFGGTDIDSRIFLRDFFRLFEPTHRVHRLVRDGMESLDYSERAEVFDTSHFLALPRGVNA